MYDHQHDTAAAAIADEQAHDFGGGATRSLSMSAAPPLSDRPWISHEPAREFLVGHAVASGFGGSIDAIFHALAELGAIFTFEDVVQELGSSVIARYAILRLVAAGFLEVRATGVLSRATVIWRNHGGGSYPVRPTTHTSLKKREPRGCGR